MSRRDLAERIYKKVFKVELDSKNLNHEVKAVILKFHDREVIVNNDNFGTRRKFLDFTEGKKKAGLHPMQICFSGLEAARICHDEYIDKDGNRRTF